MKLAIIFTCFNRAQKTGNCIRSLMNQQTKYDISMHFYICDDGSLDNTVETIKELVPNATIINGTGNLFWCKGMYLAMQSALQDKADMYLMVNDDVDFYDTALNTMLDNYYRAEKVCGIVGSVNDDKNNITYGGKVFLRKQRIGKTKIVRPNGTLQICNVANWNCFLVPYEVITDVGLIDSYYEHGCGDFDYCLMMERKGYNIYVANDYVGNCNNNSFINTSKDTKLSKKVRIKKLFSIKESPIKSNIHFYYKNYGVLGILFMIRVYIHNIIQILKV